MELQTMMRPRSDGGWMAWCDPDKPVFEHVNHDARAAHALLRAMDEWWRRPPEEDSCTDAAIIWIECRADELLREWTGGVG